MGQRKLDCRQGWLSHPGRDLGNMNRRWVIIPGPQVEASLDARTSVETVMIRASSDQVCKSTEDANFANTVTVDTVPSI